MRTLSCPAKNVKLLLFSVTTRIIKQRTFSGKVGALSQSFEEKL